MGNPVQMHAGSTTVYETIETHGTGCSGCTDTSMRVAGRCGSETVCVNPGSVYPEGLLQGVLVTLRVIRGVIKSVHLKTEG